MSLSKEISGVRLKTAITEAYIRDMLDRFVPEPLWVGTEDVDMIGALDVEVSLKDYKIIDVRHEQVELSMELKINCKKSSGIIRSTAQVNLDIHIILTPIFEQNVWNDLSVEIQNIDLLDDAKIKIGPIPLSNSMMESVLSKLKPKIESSIKSMIDVPQIVIGISTMIPHLIPILDKPKIYLNANISAVNISNLEKKEDLFQLSAQILSAANVTDIWIEKKPGLPILVTNHVSVPETQVPIKLALTWSTLNQLINQHLNKINELPAGIILEEVTLESIESKIFLIIVGDLKKLEKIKVQFELKIDNGIINIHSVNIMDIRGNVVMKNLLKVSEAFVIKKAMEVVNKKLKQLIEQMRNTLKIGQRHSLDLFDLSIQADEIQLTKLCPTDNHLLIEGIAGNLTFIVYDKKLTSDLIT